MLRAMDKSFAAPGHVDRGRFFHGGGGEGLRVGVRMVWWMDVYYEP